MMSVMYVEYNVAIVSAINGRVIPVIKNIVNKLPLEEKDTGTSTSICYQGLGDKPGGS